MAKNWFGLVQDDIIDVHIADGLEFIKQAANNGKFYIAMPAHALFIKRVAVSFKSISD